MVEKNPVKTINRSAPPIKNLIWVCAWCSKEKYPILLRGEEYTHGICRRHYRKLNSGKDFSLRLILNEVYQRSLSQLHHRKAKLAKHFRMFYSLPDIFAKTASRFLMLLFCFYLGAFSA